MSRSSRLRRDNSSVSHEIELRDCNDFFVRMITLREARQQAADGVMKLDKVWRHGKHSEPEITGAKLSGVRSFEQRPVVPITRGEADAFVGLYGESRTVHMSEGQKLMRVEKIRSEQNRIVAMDDNVERALIKMAFYPLARDHRNQATVGPQVDEAALRQFVSL